MTEIRCACDEPECKIKIRVEGDGKLVYLWITDRDGDETLMYLDPNRVVELVRELKRALLDLL